MSNDTGILEQSGTGDMPEEAIPLSSLNQYCYCPRRCALIYLEQSFVENIYTLEGRHAHEVSDEPAEEWQGDTRIVRALPLWSEKYGLIGKADVVEFRNASEETTGIPYPVDHKRGKKRPWDNDDVQLCAQAICLEEMIGVPVPKGAIFHIQSKRRREVTFDLELRTLTLETVIKVRELFRLRKTPSAVLHARCEGCSVRGVCMPEVTSDPVAALDRWQHTLDSREDDHE